MVVNASFFLVGMGDSVLPEMNVAYIGEYKPTNFGFDTFRKGMKVGDFK
jgi:hypothetical protein